MTHPPLRCARVSAGDLGRATSEVLDRVAAGETLTVTRHGAVVAVLSPLAPHPLAGLVAAGLLTPAERTHYFATERPR